jgi:hypothetical protein
LRGPYIKKLELSGTGVTKRNIEEILTRKNLNGKNFTQGKKKHILKVLFENDKEIQKKIIQTF